MMNSNYSNIEDFVEDSETILVVEEVSVLTGVAKALHYYHNIKKSQHEAAAHANITRKQLRT